MSRPCLVSPPMPHLMSPHFPSSTEPRDVGLIGIGLMGTVLAQRLLANGYRVRGWDIAVPRREELLEETDLEEPNPAVYDRLTDTAGESENE